MAYDPLTDDEVVSTGPVHNTNPGGNADPLKDQPVGVNAPSQPAPTGPQPGFMSRAWASLADIAKEAAQNLPSLTVNVPGTAPAQPVFDQPVHAPFMAGIARGVKDVTDTGTRIITDATGGDMDALRKKQQDSNDSFDKEYGDSWSASGGRIAGQTLATAPLLGGAGSTVARAVPMLARVAPGVADAIATLTGTTPAASTVGRGLQMAGQGAAAGAGSAALTGQDVGPGAVIGGIAGPLAGGATALLDTVRGLRGGLSPDIAELAQKALGYGVTPDISRMSQNPTMQIVGGQLSKLPFSGATTADVAARRAVQANLAAEMGETADQFGPQVMKNAATRIGGTIDAIANRTTIQGGAPLQNDLIGIASDMPKFGLTDAQKTPLQAQFQNVLQAFANGGGQIDGQAYRNLVQKNGPLDSVINSQDPTVSLFGSRIKDALDAAFQRSATPQDASDLSKALYQYRVMKTIEPLAAESTTGDISMGKLLSAVNAQSRRFDPSTGGVAYTGGGVMGDLGRIGKQFLAALPESGTAPRLAAWQAVQQPYKTLAASPMLAANAALQAYLRSQGVRQNLIGSSLPGAVIPSTSRAIPYTAAGATSTLQNLLGL